MATALANTAAPLWIRLRNENILSALNLDIDYNCALKTENVNNLQNITFLNLWLNSTDRRLTQNAEHLWNPMAAYHVLNCLS